MPDPRSDAQLTKHIHHFSQVYDSAVFTPHVTLVRVPKHNEKNAHSVLKQLGEAHSSFALEPEQVVCGDHPYQKVIVKIKPAGELNKLYRNTIRLFGGEATQMRNPHFSLLYGNYSCAELQPVLERAYLPLPEFIRMTTIALIRLDGLPWNWHIQCTEKLQGT